MVKNGTELVLKSRENGSFKLSPVTEDGTLMSKKELDTIIEQGLQDIKNGRGTAYTLEELRVKMGL
jgi:hypothetical protein